MATAGELEYINPQNNSFDFMGTVGDSIPLLAGERVVLESENLIAKWVVGVVPLNYEDVKIQIEKAVQGKFGVKETREISVPLESFKVINPNEPESPLFGEGFSGFHQLIPTMKKTREYVIVSRKYNQFSKVNGHSTSYWRIGDGEAIFGRQCSIIVVRRVDYSREWARGHTGIPWWPLKNSSERWLVTETEIGLLNRLKAKHKAARVQFYVPYPGFKFDLVSNLMGRIVEATKQF